MDSFTSFGSMEQSGVIFTLLELRVWREGGATLH